MAKYDVFRNSSGNGYLLDVQADLLSELSMRVVAPLLPHANGMKIVRKLNPTFVIDGKQYVMLTHLLATVPVSRLTEPRANFLNHQDEIAGALEMLFQGF